MHKELIDKIREILEVGVPLHKYGTSSWGLTKEQALKAIELFHFERIAILGGDVYVIKKEFILPNYDNWTCNPVKGESEEDFLERSINKAHDYIENYKSNFEETFYFVLVPNS